MSDFVKDANVSTNDLISRQAAIDALAIGEELLKRALDQMHVVGNEREKYEWGLGLIQSYIADMKELQSAQPTEASCWGCNCPKIERLNGQKTFSEMVRLHDAETHDTMREE